MLLVSADNDHLPTSLDELTKALPSDVTNHLNAADLPKVEEAKKLFKEKCHKNSGGDEAYMKASVS